MKRLRGLLLSGLWLVFVSGCSAGTGSNVEVGQGSAVETQEEALAVNALSPAQVSTTLKLIDDICADTWCSGDFNFGFRRLSCSRAAQTCTLTLQVFPRDGVLSKQKSYWRSCKTSGFTSFSSLVDQTDNGYQSLDQVYYDALTECTMRIVSHLG